MLLVTVGRAERAAGASGGRAATWAGGDRGRRDELREVTGGRAATRAAGRAAAGRREATGGRRPATYRWPAVTW
ncbi:unnamed protein product [Linum trigynum]|uniref:Uncharacterized protein n=1 Tax=Linum trigynum TaxID=586398 RepID=A0AAV2CAE3_9ROSI